MTGPVPGGESDDRDNPSHHRGSDAALRTAFRPVLVPLAGFLVVSGAMVLGVVILVNLPRVAALFPRAE